MNGEIHFRVSDLEAIVRKMKAKGLDVARVSFLDADPDEEIPEGLCFEAVSSVHPSTIYDLDSLDDDESLASMFSASLHASIT